MGTGLVSIRGSVYISITVWYTQSAPKRTKDRLAFPSEIGSIASEGEITSVRSRGSHSTPENPARPQTLHDIPSILPTHQLIINVEPAFVLVPDSPPRKREAIS